MTMYATIFPECENVHLKKDVGMIPYSMGKYQNYDYEIVCYSNDSFSNKKIFDYNIKFVSNTGHLILDFCRYILKNGKNIDILNLYHITSSRNACWILLYKILNPKGFVHIKLDADYRMVDMIQKRPKQLKHKIKMWIFRNLVDLYTVESKKMHELLVKEWDIPMQILPNAVDVNKSYRIASEEKCKIFLTVGRLGTEQKATQDLLKAFCKISDEVDWDLWLVGPLEESFKDYLNRFFSNYPHLKERITVWGNISDINALDDIYKKASVFILPSKWESFGIVLLEALLHGNYLITSDQVPPIEEIGNHGQFATTIRYNDIEALSDAMVQAAKMDLTDDIVNDRTKWIVNHFSWEVISSKLSDMIVGLH